VPLNGITTVHSTKAAA